MSNGQRVPRSQPPARAPAHAAAWLAAAMLLGACAGPSAERPSAASGPPLMLVPGSAPAFPDLDSKLVGEGAGLYQQQCSSCHGPDLSGDANWKTPNQDGLFPPPPLDSTGHAWHHSDRLLVEIVSGDRGYESNMPEFKGVLTETEIETILVYLKSTWGRDERQFQWQVTWQEASP